MSAPGSVTHWIAQLKEDDPAAADPLWERFFLQMVALARSRLRGGPNREADEEDVAQEAFASLWRGAVQGRFPDLTDRDDLWRLLFVITVRKALDLRAKRKRTKRGEGKVRGDSAWIYAGDPDNAGIDKVVGKALPPDILTGLAEEYQRLLDLLEDPSSVRVSQKRAAELRAIVVWKMEGYTNEQIAERAGCALSTVERGLQIIRKTWKKELPAENR
jgi:RNA polymerase sigma factor (sigma-70 family)